MFGIGLWVISLGFVVFAMGGLWVMTTHASLSVPPAPSDLTATAPFATQVDLGWVSNSTDHLGFKIYRKPTSESTWPPLENYLAHLGATVTSFMDTSVSPNTSYDYQVRAYNLLGPSAPSNTVTVTTPSNAGTDTTPPVIVTHPSLSSVTSSGGVISWAVNEAAFGAVEYGLSASLGSMTSFSSIATTAHSVTLSGLSPGTLYYWRVKTCDPFGNCARYPDIASSPLSFTTLSDGGMNDGSIPQAPSNLAATLQNNNSDLRLTWQDNSNNEDEFKIYRRPQGGTWQWISKVGGGITSFTEFGFANHFPAGTYEFKIQACNAAGCSGDSNIYPIFVQAQAASDDITPPSLVSGPTVSNVGSSSATISWSVNEPAFARVYYGTSNALGNIATSLQSTLSETQTVSLTALSSGVTYWYRIKSCDAAGNCFQSSDLYSFTTLAGTGSATISGTVRDSNGSPVANIVVAAGDTQIRYETITNASGTYQLIVAAGTWNVGVKTQREGYFNPPIQNVTVAAGAQRTGLDFQFQSDTTGVTITGTVRLFGESVPAFVWAREGLNRFKDTQTDSMGNFSLILLPNLQWYIGAGAYRNGVCYKAAPIAVTPQAGTTVTLDLVSISCPEKQEQQHDVKKDYETNLTDGTNVTAPVGAFGTSGTVTVTVAPDTTAPDTQDSSVIGIAYRIEARKSDGSLVQALSESLHLSLPYTDEALAARGISAQNLQMAFFDETQKRWARIAEAALDETAKRMRADVTHLTRFALVSAADTVAPSSPTGVRVVSAGSGALNIRWVNPGSDFHHAKLYRSTVQGQLGDLILDNFPGNAWRDAGLQNGIRYYYNVKAIDPAGNISTVDLQTSGVASATIEGGLTEGDLIRGPDGIKVYIVNGNGFKRHIFNPAVFGMYQHFKWGGIKSVSQDVLDSFITSDIYRSLNDYKVYSLLEVNEAQGLAQKQWFDITAQQFIARFYQWEQVFIVNDQERDYYQEGTPIQ